MRLDHTRIAIIERRQPEILDVALLVYRRFFVPVVGLTLVLGLPFGLLNHWLIAWMATDMNDSQTMARYLWTMCMLVYIEAPLASVLTTSYIGKAMFFENPSTKELVVDVLKLSHRLLWIHGVWRGVLLALLGLYYTEPTEGLAPVEAFLPLGCILLFLMRSLRPYINEILLLERSPLRTTKTNVISAGLRSQRLHGPHAGELFGRGVSMILVTIGLGMAVVGVLWFAIASLTNSWEWGSTMTFFVVPAALWALVAYLAVFRFLSYLDLRIRLEGWEVELKIRAEANQLKERFQVGGAS